MDLELIGFLAFVYLVMGIIIAMVVKESYYDTEYPHKKRSQHNHRIISARLGLIVFFWPIMVAVFFAVSLVALFIPMLRPIGALFTTNPFRKLT